MIVFYLDLHRITWRVSHVRQEMLTLWSTWFHVVHVVPFLFTDFANVRTSVLSVNDLVLVTLMYGLLLTLTNIYWDEAPMLFGFGYNCELFLAYLVETRENRLVCKRTAISMSDESQFITKLKNPFAQMWLNINYMDQQQW